MKMKTTYRYLAAAFAVIAAVSCAKQEISEPDQEQAQGNTYEYVLNVSQEGTKTTMDGLSILWSEGDQIGIMLQNEAGKLVSAAQAKEQTIVDGVGTVQAKFNLSVPDGHTPIAAVYPFDSACSLEDEEKKQEPTETESLIEPFAARFFIPSAQIGVKDGLPVQTKNETTVSAFPMVGKIEDGKCFMHNAGALIKFEIKRDDIVSLKFEGNNGEPISGRNYYYIETGEFKRSTGNSETTVTLTPSGDVFEPGTYYFAVAPMTLSKGFTITLTNTLGQQATRKTTTGFAIERNHKYTNFGSDEGWFKEVYTLNAGDLGSAYGSTATLYGIVTPDEIYPNDSYGFQISTDGNKWSDVEGEVTKRFSKVEHEDKTNELNVFTTILNNLTPDVTTYYRSFYRKENGITVYGKAKPFKTYANAESVKIDLYNGWSEGYWPFTNLTYGTDITSGTSGAAMNKNVDITLTTSSGSFVAKATSGFWLNMYNGCLTFKGKTGDYIKFPIIEGKKPVSVIMVIGSVNGNDLGKPSICNFLDDGTTKTTTGGGAWSTGDKASKYDSHTWELLSTIKNQQYGILLGSSNNCYISHLEVVYETVSADELKIEQDIMFSDGTNHYWPFVGDDLRNAYAILTGSNKIIGPFNTEAYPDIKYEFHIASISVQNDWRVTAGRGFRFGKAGDFMRICPVPNYRLSEIVLTEGNTAIKYSITDDDGNIVEGYENIEISVDGEKTFTLNSTTANTAYRIVLGANPAIRRLKITYERID